MSTQLRFLPFVLIVLVSGCTQVTNAIDSFFTFNDERMFDMPFPKASPVGVLSTNQFPLSPDSATLAKNNTALSLMKTATLNKLAFTFSDPTYFMQPNIDTVFLQVRNPTLGTVDLANYSRSIDAMQYTHNDFANFIKDTASTFVVSFKLLGAPSSDILAHIDAVITYTAKPL
jgi:hypothetical protein